MWTRLTEDESHGGCASQTGMDGDQRWACPECNGLATDDGTAFGDPCVVCDGDGIIEPWMLDLEKQR